LSTAPWAACKLAPGFEATGKAVAGIGGAGGGQAAVLELLDVWRQGFQHVAPEAAFRHCAIEKYPFDVCMACEEIGEVVGDDRAGVYAGV